MTLKKRLLQIFETHRGEALSGQQLADELQVSRNSVWKTVKTLQSEGYKILAATNKGYVLEKGNDILSEESLRVNLAEEYKDVDVIVLSNTSSTNAEAMTRLMNGKIKHGALIVADEQSQGRGRMGKSFFSPKSGIYMSVCLCKNVEKLTDVTLITPAAAVAVRRSIAKYTNLDAKIKWVNDIYIGKKKVCGILTQADIDFESGKAGTFIVGIGVNFINQDFPDELKDKACALFDTQPSDVTRSQIICEIYAELLKLTEDLTDRSFMREYKEYSLVVGKEIVYTINGEEKRGVVIDIDEDGGLLIKGDDGEVKLTCGEISIRSKNNEWI
ncbi:MAG: biotin--[acetyl-CoA-carboxylase] ligase [Clostridia bacterium]|nr:biotin--[acetyl-CoA-carboxylase] ligase [Clostridia bacterium]MDE7329111.1 biotin--[acetyl-CoA-carboxylase] ligase [Clostridia bacterium]